MADANDTIVASATPPGRGGVAVVRLSGPDAKEILIPLISARALPARQAVFTRFLDVDGRLLDQGLAIHFPAPDSFTGETVVELHLHGSPIIVELMLQTLRMRGARLARAGEFSERAFLNGKIDLIQAEAIADLIESGSQRAARGALQSLQGRFSAQVYALRDRLIALRVQLEGALDFSDEDIDLLDAQGTISALNTLLTEVQQLRAQAQSGCRLSAGAQLVICGKPNVGKSSLLNRLAAEEHAIVSDEAGTTRDLIKLDIELGGVPLQLIDTAGIRLTDSAVEQEGIKRARSAIGRADLVLLMVDGRADEAGQLASIQPLLADGARLAVIHNKIDLHDEAPAIQGRELTHIALSVRTGAGIELLTDWILSSLGIDAVETDTAFSARSRHLEALDAVIALLLQAQEVMNTSGEAELMAENLRLAQLTLAQITGEFSADDLLGEIFSSFCIGK